MVSWSSSCSPSPKEGRFAYMWQAVERGNEELENIAQIGTDEYLELFSDILDEIDGKTGHLLGRARFKKHPGKVGKAEFSEKNK